MRYRDKFGSWVDLSELVWREIVDRRPALAGMRDAVELTLASPDQVTEDRAGSNRRHFYRRSWLPYPYERGYVKVSVEPLWQFSVLGRSPKAIGKLQRVIDMAVVNMWPKEERRIWPTTSPRRPM